jgi:small-conductance mechanosensitive channel
VGDTVAVGETSGTVSRIRIRATTITDWDRRELIVPNKEFISFPQRDVHLDASSPLEVRVVSGTNRE